MKKTIGILGGMGPEASAYMYSLIIKHTHVEKDQDHIRIFITSNPEIPFGIRSDPRSIGSIE